VTSGRQFEGAGPAFPPSSPEPPASSQVPVWLGKHSPAPQQFTPVAVPQAVSQSESTVHCDVQLEPLSSPLGFDELSSPLFDPLDEPPLLFESSPLAPLELLEPLELLPVEASFLLLPPELLPLKPDELLPDPPQAATRATAARATVNSRIEPIFIGKPSLSRIPLWEPHVSVNELSGANHPLAEQSSLMLS
jgi:hypothetical protein